MAEDTKPAADKPKITLIFMKKHTHSAGATVDKEGSVVTVEKTYKPGDRDTFTQADADRIRKLGVAQTLINP